MADDYHHKGPRQVVGVLQAAGGEKLEMADDYRNHHKGPRQVVGVLRQMI
jgi:hypothetical protein